MTTKRILTLAAVGTLAAVSTVAISLTTWLSASAAPSEVRLHLGTDAQRFTYGTTVQVIEVGKNTCAIKNPSPQTLISLSSTSGSNSAPGLSNYGLGVKGSPSSGNGSPCAQIDSTESLTITPGTSLGTRSFTSARLDLEMTGNAVVVVTVTGSGQSKQYAMQTGNSITVPITDGTAPYQVASGPGATNATVACAAPNSSGSNNQGNDNCQWTINPGFSFTSLTITTTTIGATASLEGGGDFGNDPAFETMFTLTNAAPTAGNDSFSTNEDTAGTFSGLLNNDSDSDGDALTVTGNSSPAHGSVTPVTAAGAFTYTPAANYNGADSFTYTISDGSSTATATVNITVVPVNDPPVAVNSNPSTPEETAVTVTVGTDIDSTQLTSTCNSVPPGGTIVDNGNGTITYTPPTNFVGAVTVTCTIRDSQGATSQSSATVNVTVTNVNDPPVAVNDTASVNQNRTTPFVTNFSVVIQVLGNDTDIDAGETLAPVVVTNAAHGTAVVQGSAIQYTPAANFIGTDTFTYQANDGEALSNVATVTVSVIRVMCSGEEVTDFDTGVAATFVLLSSGSCKPYALDAVPQVGATSRYVLFEPVGASQVDYRGNITFGPEPVDVSAAGELVLKLEYDPNGGNTFQPVQLCINPQFDSLGRVISATRPGAEKWCIASETTVAGGAGQAKTTWQVFGHDDPKFQ